MADDQTADRIVSAREIDALRAVLGISPEEAEQIREASPGDLTRSDADRPRGQAAPTARFKAAYEAWLPLKFPPGSALDEWDEIHAELAYADTVTADIAVPTADGRLVSSSIPQQALHELQHVLRHSTAAVESGSSPQIRAMAIEYRDYAKALLAVVEALDQLQ